LAIAALKEDSYGEVNRTLGDVLNAMLALSIAVRDYIQAKDPRLFVGANRNPVILRGHQIARSQWIYLATSVDTAIHRIVNGYYEHLKAFEFPPEHLERLWHFTKH
jgi:hypothetical protein